MNIYWIIYFLAGCLLAGAVNSDAVPGPKLSWIETIACIVAWFPICIMAIGKAGMDYVSRKYAKK